MAPRRQAIVQLERRYSRPADEVLERLRTERADAGTIDAQAVERVAEQAGVPAAHVHGAASFYADLGFEQRGRRHVRVCAGTACFAATAGQHIADLEQALSTRCGGCSADGEVSLEPVYCLGYCYASPAALDGDEACAGPDLVAQLTGEAPRSDPEIPFRSTLDQPLLLAGLLDAEPAAWSGWPRAVNGDPAQLRAEVLAAGLRGRGGAGFPAATKWESAANTPTAEGHENDRYVICNGDEGDPGSYTDRLLMERDPHRVLEGLALAGFACGARRGIVYVRSEYPRARDALRQALDEARSNGQLGSDVHGSGFDIEIEIFEGAGSYVAGEETSLIHSIEGLRGAVSARPPYPTEHGLFDDPTVVNNVETLAALPWIVANGGEAYAAHGREGSRGTELVCLNERFTAPGVYEVELGSNLRWICEELGGGLRDGHELRALQIGGPLGGFLGPQQLDVAFAFDSLEQAGASLGHGSLIAIDERIDGPAMLEHMWTFARRESCGTCSPCRIGCQRGSEIAEQIAAEGTSPELVSLQEELLDTMGASLCAFGTSVPLAVRGIVRCYADELIAAPGEATQ